MTQILDDEEVAPGMSQDTKNVRFADDKNNSVANKGDSVIVVQSIGHGQIISNNDQQQLAASPWGDVNAFNAFVEQSKAEQNALLDRIKNLEAAQNEGDAWEENGSAPLSSAIGDIDDSKEGGGSSENLQRNKSIIRRKKECPWKYKKFPFPESTYTLLITERVLSMPFVVGMITVAGSLMCLSITLMNELDNREDGNHYGLPAGVPKAVRIAQFLGIIIGVLMEEEVPLGLEIIGKCVEQHMSGGHDFNTSKIVCSCILRVAVGYMFLACLFLTVIQADDVLEIFFDVLALQFVENIDDVVFALCKRGFFGRKLRQASNKEHAFDPPGRNTHRFSLWMTRFIRLVYCMNAALMLSGISILMVNQDSGKYRCKSKSIAFGDEVWEEAWVKLGTCNIDSDCGDGQQCLESVESDCGDGQQCQKSYCYEQRLLIYSHFNGIYVESDGDTHDGRPRYVEHNKEDGSPFLETVPAEIIYCEDLEAWVFRHKNIRTSLDELEENECSWLLKSPQTESFDLIELGQSFWNVWLGQVEREYPIFVGCNDCYDNAGCNHHGKCNSEEQRCECYDTHFGIHCEFERPCEVIRSEKDPNTTLHLLHDDADDWVHFVEVYGRPKYISEDMSGIPHGLMRLAEPDTDDKYYGVTYNGTTLTEAETLTPHRHYEDTFFEDDDFFEIHLDKPKFKELMTNYTFVLKYTGRRWYGQIKPPGVTASGFKEAEFHGFWSRTFSGVGVDDNSTVIISGPTAAGSPVGVDFYEMRRRNKAFENGIYDYD
eukprot:CAMPEP_0113387154 /NCGR_PEP_ID=MMETSP0013_2-20120614/8386_1 /TAXON_ID=2843 ORGANISM="Skeletonema costatum, Strain 1716" /NCGR_SAMPLE_ID=MMETSP0013_2 /ASSEMBLY_ACC=CAM_ASM_000158 /LENGTH=769 /DNA_ID=CAMNT_0000270033 /DNA_START=12 /DNA_END=2318 /DNA_ORIENTATION=+ /assembly_acc=CAM_ASM_000158